MGAVTAEARENARQYTKRWVRRNKRRTQAQQRAHYKKTRKQKLAYQKEYNKKNRAARRVYMVGYRFGLTKEAYEALKKKQKNRCAICRGKQVKGWKNLAVDHDHKTGKVRGLLCNRCNRVIGAMKDSPKLLWKAALYLRKAHAL
jgi:hypothetical protein